MKCTLPTTPISCSDILASIAPGVGCPLPLFLLWQHHRFAVILTLFGCELRFNDLEPQTQPNSEREIRCIATPFSPRLLSPASRPHGASHLSSRLTRRTTHWCRWDPCHRSAFTTAA